jgi:hypothetical protein
MSTTTTHIVLALATLSDMTAKVSKQGEITPAILLNITNVNDP